MGLRKSCISGLFYPDKKQELERMISDSISAVKIEKKNVKGLVSPHAGYVYSGKVAASAFSSIKNSFKTAVVIGFSHSCFGDGVATSLDDWETPLGTVDSDKEFIKELLKDSLITENPTALLKEHSIETQIPWLQYIFKDFNLVPLSFNPTYFDVETCRQVGEKIAEISEILGKEILLVASSDFTHYGSSYGYTPFGTGNEALEKMKEMDMKVIELINTLQPEKVIKVCQEKKLTICGYGCISSMLFAVKKLGAKQGFLTNYSTSFDVSKNTNAVVGYSGIIIE